MNEKVTSDMASETGKTGFSQALRGILRRLGHSPTATAGLLIVLFWVVVAIGAPWLAPYTPSASDVAALADPTPGGQHWLGTDQSGRDILSRVIWGARTVLTVAPVAVFAAYLIGGLIGLFAGYYGGLVDTLLMRGADVILSFPPLIIFIMLIMTIGPSMTNVIIAVVIGNAPQIARLLRGATLEVKTLDYVSAAQVRGESGYFIIFGEILPNLRRLIFTDGCMRFGFCVVAIGVLGFLGLGLPPPTPDWGGMVKDTTKLLTVWPHMALIPAVALSSLVVGFNLLADGLQENVKRRG